MIRFEYFTRAQAIEWQAAHPKVEGDPLTDMRLTHFENVDLDQKVGIFAIDNDRMIGTNFLYYCPISVNGKLVECIVTNNLYVHPDYRPKGVGTFLKMYILKLGYPQISSGVSPSMRKVYDAWSAYTKIDASPVFVMPVDAFGLLRVSRMSSEREAGKAGGRIRLAKKILSGFIRALSIRNTGPKNVRVLSPVEAEARLHEVLHAASFPIQVPWNRDLVVRSIWGLDAKAHAWMVEVGCTDARSTHLVTGYLRAITARGLGSLQRRVQELHLTEIFPPASSEAVARACLQVVSRKARATGASIVHVSAMTGSLRSVCEKAGLDSFYEKRVYIAPNTKDGAMDELMRTPANWWCRIRNEDQLEENAFRRAGQHLSEAAAELPAMIY